MKGLWSIFVLTPREQRLVILVVLALVIAAWVKHYREEKTNEGRWISGTYPVSEETISPPPNE